MSDEFDAPTLVSEHACFGGVQRFYRHQSREIGLPMRFALYLPPQAQQGPVPAVVYLAGLTCTEETFPAKAGAQRVAAELGLALIAPDTSPRGTGVPGEADSWDFGVAAGFYLDATQQPWAGRWRMESYLMQELLPLVGEHLPVSVRRLGLMGHSMGGHGALTLAYRHPDRFRSLSALAPICAPMSCPWGRKAFAGYLGDETRKWKGHDATELIRHRHAEGLPPLFPRGILVDQGLADQFLAEQLHPHLLEEACAWARQPLTLRRHAGYDHGYYFIASFVEEHLRFHSAILQGSGTPAATAA
ncbi:MAG: S-formylglutathione hydrolase [Pseudomonadota bacterium]|jgi:S-formylglutathione hydrolase